MHLSRDDVAGELRGSGLAASASHGVNRYRVGYCTVAPSGSMTVASGLIALPQVKAGRLPVLVYLHGTNAARTEAPSFLGTAEGRLAPLVFAAEGFAVAAPDYLGLGISEGRHPYVHAATEASASVDLLQAAAMVGARRGTPLSRDVFVSGHSQGGHATMALGRELQPGRHAWRLRALAPMSGPYDMSGTTLPAALDPARTDPAVATVYLAYLFTSWKSLYELYTDPRNVFAEAYATSVENLFDGEHGMSAVRDALPDSPHQLFRPTALAQIAHPTGRLAEALRDNDVCRWAPVVPTRLYAARGDRDVVFAHTEQCHQQIVAHGGSAQVVDLGEINHIGTALVSLPMIRDWFSELSP